MSGSLELIVSEKDSEQIIKELGENVSDLMARVAVNLIYNTDYPIYHLNPQI